MIGSTVMNPLASTVLSIRKGATTSFEVGFEQLSKEEKAKILSEFEFLTANTLGTLKLTAQSAEGYIRQSD